MRDQGKVLSETVWQRGRADSKERLHSLWFLLVETVWGGVLTAMFYSEPPMTTTLIVVGGLVLLAIFFVFAAAVTAPLRQRDDARKLANALS